jgi:hypothetical protein
MDAFRDVLGIDLSEEELRRNLAGFADILEAIRKLRSLDLTEVHPAVVYDPLLPYRADRP